VARHPRVVPRELEIEALAGHAALDATDTAPGVEPEPQQR